MYDRATSNFIQVVLRNGTQVDQITRLARLVWRWVDTELFSTIISCAKDDESGTSSVSECAIADTVLLRWTSKADQMRTIRPSNQRIPSNSLLLRLNQAQLRVERSILHRKYNWKN